MAIEENFLRGPYGLYYRQPKQNEVEYQFGNQYHFAWLSGDDVTQSLVHNVDRATWAMKEQTPVKAHGLGGRSASFGEVYGNVFDHHSVVYEYANGVRMYAFCRTQNGCYDEYASIYLRAPRAAATCHAAAAIEGETNWQVPGPRRQSLRPRTQGRCSRRSARATRSTAATTWPAARWSAVMGQLACYSGKELTWEQVSKSDFVFAPKVEDVRLDMEPPVKPDAKGKYPVPMPGITEFKI